MTARRWKPMLCTSPPIYIEPSIAAFAVMLFSMGLDWWRSRVLGRIATKYDSQALEADALHFSTDLHRALDRGFRRDVVLDGARLVALARARPNRHQV